MLQVPIMNFCDVFSPIIFVCKSLIRERVILFTCNKPLVLLTIFDCCLFVLRKGSPNAWKSSVKVYVTVHQSGVSALSFDDGIDSKEVSENLSLNSKIMSVSTVNGGTNIEYTIVGGNTENVFRLTLDGQLMLRDSLDAEKVSEYKLVVRATDKSTPPKYVEKVFVVKVKDENDNSPVFAVDKPAVEKKIYIDQFSPRDTIIQRVSSTKSPFLKNVLQVKDLFIIFVTDTTHFHEVVKVTESQWDLGGVFKNSVRVMQSKIILKSITMTIKSK